MYCVSHVVGSATLFNNLVKFALSFMYMVQYKLKKK
jgi:hypothetical protein